ncbi:hypothetical protein KEM56_004938 [Ascosphaera pollenicola]|nr:hypothetical protein KEM56_004938 [Ascosphaera pollenicola]
MKLNVSGLSTLCATFVFHQLSYCSPAIYWGFAEMTEDCDGPTYLEYTAVPGYFKQDDPKTDPETFDYRESFGLVERSYDTDKELPGDIKNYTQWERFAVQVAHMNAQAPPNVQYKLIFAGRHGEGYHNVAQATYGNVLWDCYWAMQTGNGTASWDDALLTPLGVSQAEEVQQTWAKEMKRGIPLPEVHIVSPLRRCIMTANHTFGDLDLPHTRPFRPVIKELCRETIGLHTCDRRSTKTVIEEFAGPRYTIENCFTENDLLWTPDVVESNTARNARFLKFLDEIFDAKNPSDKDYYPLMTPQAATYISITAHSGAITSMLNVTNHREFPLQTGAVIPIFVKVERKDGVRPTMKIDPPERAPQCPPGFQPPNKN